MKKLLTITSLLLICTLMLSSTPLIFGNFAIASTGAANFHPNYWYNGTGTVDTYNEHLLTISTAQYITSRLASRYPTSYFSAIGSICTLQTYQNVTSYLQNNYDNVVIFSKGHRSRNGQHIALADHYGTGLFFDYDIATRTSYIKNKFTFIWHCQTAELYTYGGPNTDVMGRAISMPYAFTHNHYLPEYGTTGHQVYLGWKDKNPLTVYNYTTQQYNNVMIMGNYLVGSPQYEWGIDPYYNYADVAKQFWNNMCNGQLTYNALNNLSYNIYGRSFTTPGYSNNDLYGWLIAYGNWNYVGLPP